MYEDLTKILRSVKAEDEKRLDNTKKVYHDVDTTTFDDAVREYDNELFQFKTNELFQFKTKKQKIKHWTEAVRANPEILPRYRSQPTISRDIQQVEEK